MLVQWLLKKATLNVGSHWFRSNRLQEKNKTRDWTKGMKRRKMDYRVEIRILKIISKNWRQVKRKERWKLGDGRKAPGGKANPHANMKEGKQI